MQKHLVLCTIALALSAALAFAAPATLFQADFEGSDAATLLGAKPGAAKIADEGCKSDHSASLEKTGKFCSMVIQTKGLKVQAGTMLSFDYRQIVHEGAASYLGVQIRASDGKIPITTAPTGSSEWKHFEVNIMKLGPAGHAKNKDKLVPGDVISSIDFYGRGKESSTRQTIYIDNVRLTTK